jgi:hypothetical protein
MLQITLGRMRHQPDDHDDNLPPRTLAGWDKTMTEIQVYDAARGWWRQNVDRARSERFAVVVAAGHVRQIIEINPDEWTYAPNIDRWAFSGTVLQAGHPVYERYIGQTLPPSGQNPIRYLRD